MWVDEQYVIHVYPLSGGDEVRHGLPQPQCQIVQDSKDEGKELSVFRKQKGLHVELCQLKEMGKCWTLEIVWLETSQVTRQMARCCLRNFKGQ